MNVKPFPKVPEGDFSGLEKAIEDREKRETRRFWIPVIIAIIALVVAGWSLAIQIKYSQRQTKSEQQSKPHPVIEDSTNANN